MHFLRANHYIKMERGEKDVPTFEFMGQLEKLNNGIWER